MVGMAVAALLLLSIPPAAVGAGDDCSAADLAGRCGDARSASPGDCLVCVESHAAFASCTEAQVDNFCAGLAPPAADPTDPGYDHQTREYKTVHRPVTVGVMDATSDVFVTPYFSPTNSSSTLVSFIESATTTIDIGTPGFSSWSRCTPYAKAGETCTKGCTPAKQRLEKFPIFAALLNAVHRGVKVRVLTNKYEPSSDCPGTITPLPFLQLNGVEVAFYTSTAFYHAKYMSIDGVKMSISSINFSLTSFTRNREAGCLIEGKGALPLVQMAASVFEADWGQALPAGSGAPAEPWSTANHSIITDTTHVNVTLPKPSPTWAAYWNPPTPTKQLVSGAGTSLTISTSPDFSSHVLMEHIANATTSLDVMIYQITGDDIADALVALAQRGVAVRLLVSSSIFGAADCKLANAVYTKIAAAVPTIHIYKTSRHYEYSHQKFWIIDGAQVGWSTGNWGNSDFPASSVGDSQVTYPVYGKQGPAGQKWEKLNRDYELYIKHPGVAAAFSAVFKGDSDFDHTFPSPVYKWTPKFEVACGTGD